MKKNTRRLFHHFIASFWDSTHSVFVSLKATKMRKKCNALVWKEGADFVTCGFANNWNPWGGTVNRKTIRKLHFMNNIHSSGVIQTKSGFFSRFYTVKVFKDEDDQAWNGKIKCLGLVPSKIGLWWGSVIANILDYIV